MSENSPKPSFSVPQAKDLLSRLYDLEDTEIRPLPSFDDQNFYISSSNGDEFVLKILNADDSKNPALVEVQMFAMSCLSQNGIPVQEVVSTNTGELWSLQELDSGFGRQEFIVRLLTYLPGVIISEATPTPQLLYEIGKMAAKIDNVLHKMKHPDISALERDGFMSDLSNLPLLEKYLFALDGDPLQEVVKSVMEQFSSSVAPKYPYFRKCIIHGDLNDLNILVQPDGNGSFKISGILDFGDMNSGFYIHELAITMMHMMTGRSNPVEVGGAVLEGWVSELPLNKAERDSLHTLVLSRLCQIVCFVRHGLLTDPQSQYLRRWSRRVDRLLLDFWTRSREQVERVWFQADV